MNYLPQPHPSQPRLSVAVRAPAARYGSLDVLRVVAALGVILIHSESVSNHQISAAVVRLRNGCAWVVPFFLCAAFFFAARREMKGDSPWKPFVKARSARLLVPFLFWGALYTSLRAALYLRQGQSGELRALLQDPVALMFNGGAVALYFLPLLFVGLLGLRALSPLYRRLPIQLLGLCWVAFLLLEWRVNGTGNQFDQDTARAFGAWTAPIDAAAPLQLGQILPARVGLVLLCHFLRCAPLISFAFLLVRLDSAPQGERIRRVRAPAAVGLGALIFALWSAPVPGANFLLLADLTGMCGVLTALSLSGSVPTFAWLSTIGIYTFGIYLVHQLVLTLLKLAIGNHLARPMGAPVALTVTLLTFAASLALTALAARGGAWGRRLFAIET